jgi:uncharacterized BrkB/YihY/UPF0761 family membrane protein
MDDNNVGLEAVETTSEQEVSEELSTQDKIRLFVIGLVALVVLGLLIWGAIFLFQQDAGDTSHIRDIFIIFIALEVFVVGIALVILMIQLAALINLLQNEIKPILKTTNETANNLRGTAVFLSNNLTEPVIKLNQYLAALKKLLDLSKIIK